MKRMWMFAPGDTVTTRDGIPLGWVVGEVRGGDGILRVRIRTPENHILLYRPDHLRKPRKKALDV